MTSSLRFLAPFASPSSSLAVAMLFSLLALSTFHQQGEGAYTYQKMNELLPELRQYLGRTHLGTLRPLSGAQRSSFFVDDDQIQFRERKSNNLRNLMRIGKRRVPTVEGVVAAAAEEPSLGGTLPAGGNGAVYYFSPSFPNDNHFQPYRPQTVWL